MRTLKSLALVGLFGALAAAPVAAGVPDYTFTGCGGTNFSTCMSVDVFFVNGNYVYIDVHNTGGGSEVFTRVGVVNVDDATTVTSAAPNPGNWSFEGEQNNGGNGLSGDGLPPTVWAYQANPSPMTNGIHEGEHALFGFAFDPSVALEDIGFAVQAQGGPGGCSTKFGFWYENGQIVTNDVGAGNYDETCVNVPEPESGALLLTGLAGLAFVATRRRNGLELIDEDGSDLAI